MPAQAMSRGKERAVCAVTGCGTRATGRCGRCARPICARHTGKTARGAVGRCALCRLDGRRRAGALARYFWLAAAIAGFLLIEAFALYANPRQGIALLLLVPLVVLLAFAYRRSLRYGVPLLPWPWRRSRRRPQPARDGE